MGSVRREDKHLYHHSPKSGHWTLHHLSWPFSNIFRFLFWCRASRDEAAKEKWKLKFKSWKASLCRLNEHKQSPSQALNAENQINVDHHKARGTRSDRNCLRNKFLAAPELKNGNILKKRTKKTGKVSMEKDEPAQERSNLNKGKQHFFCGVAKKKIRSCVSDGKKMKTNALSVLPFEWPKTCFRLTAIFAVSCYPQRQLF